MGAGRIVRLGDVSGVFGVRGWLKVYSYTDPRDGILEYAQWQLTRGGKSTRFVVEEGKRHGNGILARLRGVDDRDTAGSWVGAEIGIDEAQLESLTEGEYYWAQLIGLTVVNLHGERLGVVSRLMSTAAHDVLVVRGDRERLIPYAPGPIVKWVRVQDGALCVDWEADY